jgi:hypothetical protein
MSGWGENRAMNWAAVARYFAEAPARRESGHESGHRGPIRSRHQVRPAFRAMNPAVVARRETGSL